MNCKSLSALLAATISLSLAQAQAGLLTHINFDDGLPVGTTIADNASAAGSIGVNANFDGIVNGANSVRVAGISRNPNDTSNAIQLANSARFRSIIDRGTPEWGASGLVGGDTLIGSGAISGTLFGSVLIENVTADAAGFTGLEFAAGDPNGNRVITLGEAPTNALGNNADFVVLGPGQASGMGSDIPLPLVQAGVTREIIFRIDYAANATDIFSLLNPDGTAVPGATGTGSFQFSTLHLAAFSGAPPVIYDEIRLGTTLESVLPVPEPTAFATLGLMVTVTLARRRLR